MNSFFCHTGLVEVLVGSITTAKNDNGLDKELLKIMLSLQS